MSTLQVPLRLRDDQPIWLRELRGDDELAVDGTDTAAAISLVDALLVDRPGAALVAGEAATLATAERDLVLAALCVANFGDLVHATRSCSECGGRYDLDFQLTDLATSVRRRISAAPPAGRYVADDGTRFRLPTGADELAVAGLASSARTDALLARCVADPPDDVDAEAVVDAMERVAPTIDLDLDAPCSECGADQVVSFSVQTWVLELVRQARADLTGDVHALASWYGWSLTDCLALPRSQRLSLVALVDDDRRAAVRMHAS